MAGGSIVAAGGVGVYLAVLVEAGGGVRVAGLATTRGEQAVARISSPNTSQTS